MFEIDTGNAFRPATKSDLAVGNGRLDWSRDHVAAERFHRQTIAVIRACETEAEVVAFMAAESLCIDALAFTHPHYAASIDGAEKEHRAILRETAPAQAVPRPAAPANPSAQNGNTGKDDNDDFFF